MAMIGSRRIITLLKQTNSLRNNRLPLKDDIFMRQLTRHKASSANIVNGFDNVDVTKENATDSLPDPAYQKIDPTFENAQEAYKSKTNGELIRALFVFSLCSIRPLVDNNKEIMTFCRKVLGQKAFVNLMKMTFYGQFVAGHDTDTVRPTAERNRSFGVKSILDYSVEKDISKEEAQEAEMDSTTSLAESCSPIQPESAQEPSEADISTKFRPHERFGDRREGVTGARTYFYENEEHCDENMNTFLNSIDCVSGATNATGFAAIKMTALGRPQLLLQLSEVLTRVRHHFDILSTATGTKSGAIKKKDFERYLKRINLDEEESKKWYTILDVNQDGEIDLLDWHNLLEVNVSLAKLLRVPNLASGSFEPVVSCLSDEEEQAMKNMLRRIDTIAKYGKEKDVRVMIDAEQSYFQPAINRLTVEMMRKYNREKAIVFNTYQCYLKETHANIVTDLALSKRENFFFGAKLVRGAYLEQERLRAATLGYEDPINPSYEATTAMYEKVLDECLSQILQRPRGEIAVMVASHNEETVRYTLQRMQSLGIKSTDRVVCFGQLLGMCDQVSFSLGQSGYSVYKYVPYGPVEDVLPYLSRRALENRGILKKVKKEKRLLRQELFRRLSKLQFFYRPTPPDVDPLAQTAPSSK